MPRTKLCNYLYVRLKTILTSARARACARVMLHLCVPVMIVHLHMRAIIRPHPAREKARGRVMRRRSHACDAERTRVCVSACVCVYAPTVRHVSHLSPKAHERHISWPPIMPCLLLLVLVTTTISLTTSGCPWLTRTDGARLLEYNDYHYLLPRIVLQ